MVAEHHDNRASNVRLGESLLPADFSGVADGITVDRLSRLFPSSEKAPLYRIHHLCNLRHLRARLRCAETHFIQVIQLHRARQVFSAS